MMFSEDQLKQYIDEQLSQVKFSDRAKNRVEMKCQEISVTSKKIKLKKYIPTLGLIICLLGGTVMAMSGGVGFDLFFSMTNLEKVKTEENLINKEVTVNDVTLVVEEAIQQKYNMCLTLSFINKTDIPWPQDIFVRGLRVDQVEETRIGEKYVSADGKKLSYIIGTFNGADNPNGQKLTVEANDLIRINEYNESVDIDMREIYEDHGVVAKWKKEEEEQGEFAVLTRIAKEIIESKGVDERSLSNEAEFLSLVGMCYLYNENIEALRSGFEETGVVIFTYNNDRIIDSEVDKYARGGITELVDTRSGQHYETTKVHKLYLGKSKPTIQANYFPNIAQEQIPYLKAVKVTYTCQETIQSGDWEVNFDLKPNNNLKEVDTKIKYTIQGEEVTIDKVYLSPLGVEIEGTGNHYNLYSMDLIKKNGEHIELLHWGGGIKQDHPKDKAVWIKNYLYNQVEDGELVFQEVEDIKELLINGDRIPLQ